MAENENTKAKKQVPLRLSASLYDELARWAEDDFRSINGQIEYLLTECVNKRRKSKSKLVFQMTAEELANSGFEIDLPDGSKKRYRNFREFLCELDEENGSTWAYAHKVSGIHWLICGAIGLLCPIALAVLGFTGTIYGNGCLYGLLAAEAFQQILLLSVMPVTEHKLKNKFNEDGTLR